MIEAQAAPRTRGFSARVSAGVATYLVPLGGVLLTVAVLGIASLDAPGLAFRSPGEHAGFLFTRVFAETGQLSYTSEEMSRAAKITGYLFERASR